MLYIRFGAFFEMRGILLALAGDTIRVALEDCGDAAEFRRVDNAWISENGEPVEIEWREPARAQSFALPPRPVPHRRVVPYCVI